MKSWIPQLLAPHASAIPREWPFILMDQSVVNSRQLVTRGVKGPNNLPCSLRGIFFFPVSCHTILLVTFLCPDIVIRIYFQGRLGYVVFILMDICSVKNSVTMKGGENEYWGTTVCSVPLLSNCLRRVFVLLS